jgi:hypothetical protein
MAPPRTLSSHRDCAAAADHVLPDKSIGAFLFRLKHPELSHCGEQTTMPFVAPNQAI